MLWRSLHQNPIPIYILAYVNDVKKVEGSKRYEQAMSLINTLAQESGGKVILANKRKEIEDKAVDIVRVLHAE